MFSSIAQNNLGLKRIPCTRNNKLNLGRQVSIQVKAQALQPRIEEVVTGIAFKPFTSARDQLNWVESGNNDSKLSCARTAYEMNCELAINEQINREYTNSYVYHQLYVFFDRDNVGLPNIAQYFKENSAEEREHAEKLMAFQNRRGGKVALKPIMVPEITEYWGNGKTDALLGFELALALERLNFMNLRHIQQEGVKADDAEYTDFIESEFLHDQVQDIREKAVYVAQLRRIGIDGHGVWDFDQQISTNKIPVQ